MVTDNHNIEFGYELIAVIPFAYWLHTQGKLTGTISNFDSSLFYYFSPNHTERDERRHSRKWKDMRLYYDNGDVHRSILDLSRWVPPPYKNYYANDEYNFKKPLLIVTNKYNLEWKNPPANYLDVPMLEWIFRTYRDDYEIVYSRFRKDMGYDDTVDTMDLGEWDLVKSMRIKTIQDLKKDGESYNFLQLKLYPHCEKFITVQGGTAILASYFGGDNIIFARKGMEIKRKTYQNWYSLFGGSRIHHVQDYGALKACSKKVLSLS